MNFKARLATPFLPHTRSSLAAFVVIAVALFAYLSLFKGAFIDDAFITLRYVKTLSESGTWGFFPDYVSNTATSPLNVLLLTIVNGMTRSPVDAVVWLTMTALIASALLLRGIASILKLPLFGWLAFTALVFNPFLMSTLGLESVLFTTFLIAAVYFYLSQRFDAMVIACGLLTLTRPDGILLLAILVVPLPHYRARFRAVVLYLLCIAPWYLFSWAFLGSFLSETLVIKVNQSWGTIVSYGNGLLYYIWRYPTETLLSFLSLPLAGLAFLKPVRGLSPLVPILAVFGLLHYVAYTAMRVPPYHWYYVPQLVCVVLLGALATAALLRNAAARFQRGGSLALILLALGIPPLGMLALVAQRGAPLQEALVHTNWATPAQYRAIGEWLKENHGDEIGTLENPGEIGTIAYYCDCILLDELFNDRTWVTNWVAEARRRTDMRALLVKINYLFYKAQPPFPPPQYTLVSLQPRISQTLPNPTSPYWDVASRGGSSRIVFVPK
jgi:hypothetical protein